MNIVITFTRAVDRHAFYQAYLSTMKHVAKADVKQGNSELELELTGVTPGLDYELIYELAPTYHGVLTPTQTRV